MRVGRACSCCGVTGWHGTVEFSLCDRGHSIQGIVNYPPLADFRKYLDSPVVPSVHGTQGVVVVTPTSNGKWVGMLGHHMRGDEADTSATASSAVRSSKEGNGTGKARPAGLKPQKGNGVRVAQFVSGIFAQLDKAILPRLQQEDAGRGACGRSSFDEENTYKQPLLAKVGVMRMKF